MYMGMVFSFAGFDNCGFARRESAPMPLPMPQRMQIGPVHELRGLRRPLLPILSFGKFFFCL